MSKNLKRYFLEELFFAFKTGIAKKEDYERFHSLLEKYNHKYHPYFDLIKKFFQTNYGKTLREQIIVYFKDNSNILSDLDNKFIPKWNPEELLKHLNDDYCFKNNDDFLKKSIKSNIESLIAKGKVNENISLELVFYLRMFSYLQDETNSGEVVLELLNLFKNKFKKMGVLLV